MIKKSERNTTWAAVGIMAFVTSLHAIAATQEEVHPETGNESDTTVIVCVIISVVIIALVVGVSVWWFFDGRKRFNKDASQTGSDQQNDSCDDELQKLLASLDKIIEKKTDDTQELNKKQEQQPEPKQENESDQQGKENEEEQNQQKQEDEQDVQGESDLKDGPESSSGQEPSKSIQEKQPEKPKASDIPKELQQFKAAVTNLFKDVEEDYKARLDAKEQEFTATKEELETKAKETLENEKKALREAFEKEKEEQKATHQKEIEGLHRELKGINKSWEKKLNGIEQTHSNEIAQLKSSHQYEVQQLNGKLQTIDAEWGRKYQEQKTTLETKMTNIQKEADRKADDQKSRHQNEINTLKESHQKEVAQLNSDHQRAIKEEKSNTAEYRKHTAFVMEPREEIIDYAKKALDIFQLMRNTRIRAQEMKDKGVFNDENVAYFYQKSMDKFTESVADDITIQAWMAELPLFVKSGLYSTAADAQLRSVLNGQADCVRQLSSLKTRLHHDVMARYASASLVLLQELASLDKLSGVAMDKASLRLFADNQNILLKKLASMGYEVKMVELLSKFKGSDDVKAVNSISINAFQSEAILEVRRIGVRFGGSKEKTEVVINQ